MPTEKCVFCLYRLNNWEDWEASSNTPWRQGSHNRLFTTKMCKVSEWPSNHCWGNTSLMIMGIIITKWLWHIQAITLQKGNYSTQELTPSRKWLQGRQALQHSLCMSATNCRTLLADHEVLALHHPLNRSIRAAADWYHHLFPLSPSGSWVFMVCRQIRQNGLSLHHYSPNFLQSIPCPVPCHLSQRRASQKTCFWNIEQNLAFILSSPSMLEFSLTSQFIIKTILQQHLQGIM